MSSGEKIIARRHEWPKADRVEDGVGVACATVNGAPFENRQPTRTDAVKFEIPRASNKAAGSVRLITPD